MRTPREIIAEPSNPDEAWEETPWGVSLKCKELNEAGWEISLEPLLFGAWNLAVYKYGILVGEKMPVTIGTPAHNGKQWDGLE